MSRFNDLEVFELYMIETSLKAQDHYYRAMEETCVGIHTDYKKLLDDVATAITEKEAEEEDAEYL